jgi:hypothetical protein
MKSLLLVNIINSTEDIYNVSSYFVKYVYTKSKFEMRGSYISICCLSDVKPRSLVNRNQPKIERNLLLPSPLNPTLLPWRWRQQFPPKHCYQTARYDILEHMQSEIVTYFTYKVWICIAFVIEAMYCSMRWFMCHFWSLIFGRQKSLRNTRNISEIRQIFNYVTCRIKFYSYLFRDLEDEIYWRSDRQKNVTLCTSYEERWRKLLMERIYNTLL